MHHGLYQLQPCFAANLVERGHTGAGAFGVLGAQFAFAGQPVFKNR